MALYMEFLRDEQVITVINKDSQILENFAENQK